MELKVHNDRPIILVDGSYFIYHRFFATLRWYSFRNKEIDSSVCLDIDEFREALLKHTKDTVMELRKTWAKKYKTQNKRLKPADIESVQVWFAMDCHRIDVWRTALFPNYKGTRVMSADCDVRCFDMIYNYIRNELAVPCLEMDGLEADDLIALTHKHLRSVGFTGHIVCITNDNDYLQLKDEETSLYNLQEKDITIRSIGDPKKDLLLKILNGDKSDNISAVRPKLSNKKIKEMLELYSTEEELLGSLQFTDQEQERFTLNRKLVDFSYIPTEFTEKYQEQHKITVIII